MADSTQDEPTLDEAKRMLSSWAEVELRMNGRNSSHGLYITALLAAYTRMEADMAEARKALDEAELAMWAPLPARNAGMAARAKARTTRALAAFYNKGEE